MSKVKKKKEFLPNRSGNDMANKFWPHIFEEEILQLQ
jgi:hypothetical protein